MKQIISGNIVDIHAQKISEGKVTISGGRIATIHKGSDKPNESLPYILPGFIDAHVHIESSMLVPSEFARLAVVHGTVATISDPHEIANVCGLKGVQFMLDNGESVPFKFHFGAPSCVPATTFETAGATLNVEKTGSLLGRENIYYLSEMMNFPGVLNDDPEVMSKIALAKKFNKPVDGHAPGLMGTDAIKYIEAGISTDHECFTAAEALHKLNHGMKILIREGSAARNFDALIDLLNDWPDDMMFCSDDKHPDSLVAGHINLLCRRAIEKGIDLFKVLKAACVNPIIHYKMEVGQLRFNDPADFIICKDLKDFEILATYVNGYKVAEKGKSLIDPEPGGVINQFNCLPKKPADFEVKNRQKETNVIHALDGQLITESGMEELPVKNGLVMPDPDRDILKITVVNRYQPDAVPAVAFIKNFGLKKAAIASSVAHDSHNIIAVGPDDQSIARAVNLIIEHKGGVSIAGTRDTDNDDILPLPVAGLMSTDNGYAVAEAYTRIDRMAKEAGSSLASPFMTLSFMALLVIPKLKLSDKGLFDGEQFRLIS